MRQGVWPRLQPDHMGLKMPPAHRRSSLVAYGLHFLVGGGVVPSNSGFLLLGQEEVG